MSKTRYWHTKAIYALIALAFVLGLTLMPATVGATPAPTLVPPHIDFDVKGDVHKVCIDPAWWDELGEYAVTDWWLESGVNLNPQDITVIAPTGPNPDYNGTKTYEETIKVKGLTDNQTACIEIRSMKRGDIHIFVKVTLPEQELEWTLHTEKKWGEIVCTELDVDTGTRGVQHTKSVEFEAGSSGPYYETLEDTVWAYFYEYGVELADGAIVHWWLVEDTEENQEWVDHLMDYLAGNQPEELEDVACEDPEHWGACGKYKASELDGKQPWQYINDWVTEPGNEKFPDTDLFYWDDTLQGFTVDTAPNTDVWYGWSVSEDGKARARLVVDVGKLKACETYNIMIVVLVSYPGGSTPQQDPFNGENIVCVEKAKKSFHKGKPPVITQVKTPQLRWAGEKIVLEKEWPVEPEVVLEESQDGTKHIGVKLYAAIYSLEEGSVGNLEPVNDIGVLMLETADGEAISVRLDYLGLPAGAQQVIAPLGGYYRRLEGAGESWGGFPDTQAILCSEQSGEADVNAALYELYLDIYLPPEGPPNVIMAGFNGPIMNHGFLVYFLEFEDVTLAEDITPSESLSGLTAGEDAQVAVRVRGFFDYRHSRLMETMREEKPIDLNGDGVVDKKLPAGRYVLPDDWWLIAETQDIELRPNFDLMDRANLDDIVSPPDANGDHREELGPYDTGVRTTDPPGEAEYPTIGPFSTYQQWSTEDKWIAAATVPASYWEGPLDLGERNTVVPDGIIDEWDAPMPPALVIFKIVAGPDDAALAGLDKGDLEGYGYVGSPRVYQSPFYAVEIPANWQIPSGYNWESWTREPDALWRYAPVQGPYPFWKDLQLASIISNTHEAPVNVKDVEVYSDNHGIAAVTVEALRSAGRVSITATADFPYIPKRGKYGPRVSDVIDIIWGPALVHLNPDFEATPRSGAAPLEVSFDPSLTTGGTPPYVKAEWDFNGDGIVDVTRTGSWNTPGDIPDETWTYTSGGVFTVSLTITDSTPAPVGPLVHTETKVGYIEVSGVAFITWNCPLGGQPLIAPNPGAGRPYLNVAVDCDEIVPSVGAQIWGIYYLVETGPEAGTWKWYIPGFASSTLTELVPGEFYWVVVSAPCTLTIPQ